MSAEFIGPLPRSALREEGPRGSGGADGQDNGGGVGRGGGACLKPGDGNGRGMIPPHREGEGGPHTLLQVGGREIDADDEVARGRGALTTLQKAR